MKWELDFVGPIIQHEGTQGTNMYRWLKIMQGDSWGP
jgi:hypothetical protein